MSFNYHSTKFSPHIVHSIYFQNHTSLFPQKCNIPTKSAKELMQEPKKELIRLSDVISRLTNDHRLILSSSIKNTFLLTHNFQTI